MTFFAPIPDPEPEPQRHYFPFPGQRPHNWLPGSSTQVVLAESDSSAVVLHVRGAYPQGLALSLEVLLHPDRADTHGRHQQRRHERGYEPMNGLRLGFLWPDGRRVDSVERGWDPGDGEDQDASFHLSPGSGGGGGLHWEWELWLWPLPPAGPVEVFVEWDDLGIAETRTEMDLTDAVARAADARELWHLDRQPRGQGWFAYAPLGSTVRARQATVGPARTVELPVTDGPETVPGAAELIAAGFEPIESLTGAVWVAAVWPEEHRRAVREARHDVPGYEDPELGWLPTTARDQLCALCRDEPVGWLHPLASDKVRYRVYGKGHTLPTFWTLCERCESLYTAGVDDLLIELMQRAVQDPGDAGLDDMVAATSLPETYVDEVYWQQLAVFRRADLGARRFRESAPENE